MSGLRKRKRWKRRAAWTAILVALFFATFGYVPPSFLHPDYGLLQGRFAAAKPYDKLDLSQLNGGRWTLACVFGGNTRPSEFMSKHGEIDLVDRLYQPLKNAPLMRLGEVEENETVVAFVDLDKQVTFLHFKEAPSQTVDYALSYSSVCVPRTFPVFVFRN